VPGNGEVATNLASACARHSPRLSTESPPGMAPTSLGVGYRADDTLEVIWVQLVGYGEFPLPRPLLPPEAVAAAGSS